MVTWWVRRVRWVPWVTWGCGGRLLGHRIAGCRSRRGAGAPITELLGAPQGGAGPCLSVCTGMSLCTWADGPATEHRDFAGSRVRRSPSGAVTGARRFGWARRRTAVNRSLRGLRVRRLALRMRAGDSVSECQGHGPRIRRRRNRRAARAHWLGAPQGGAGPCLSVCTGMSLCTWADGPATEHRDFAGPCFRRSPSGAVTGARGALVGRAVERGWAVPSRVYRGMSPCTWAGRPRDRAPGSRDRASAGALRRRTPVRARALR